MDGVEVPKGANKTSDLATLTALLAAAGKDVQSGTHGPSKGPPTTLLAEGIPPILTRLLERISKWEHVDSSDILTEIQHKTEDSQFSLSSSQSQIILVQSADQFKKKKKQITDMESWLQAFSVFAAALASDSSSKPRAWLVIWCSRPGWDL